MEKKTHRTFVTDETYITYYPKTNNLWPEIEKNAEYWKKYPQFYIEYLVARRDYIPFIHNLCFIVGIDTDQTQAPLTYFCKNELFDTLEFSEGQTTVKLLDDKKPVKQALLGLWDKFIKNPIPSALKNSHAIIQEFIDNKLIIKQTNLWGEDTYIHHPQSWATIFESIREHKQPLIENTADK